MDDWKVRIIVLDRGFVKACECPDPMGYALWLPYRNGRTIRRWGTENGLSQLLGGPLPDTILDPRVPEGVLPVRAIIDILNAESESWLNHLTDESSPGATRRTASRSSRTTSRSAATS